MDTRSGTDPDRSGSYEDMSQSTDCREAGGNAMRRPPEVGQAGLLVVLLLGVSGCAGFPQRTGVGSPWPNSADGQSVTPPGLLSWWHRGSANRRPNRRRPTCKSIRRGPSSATPSRAGLPRAPGLKPRRNGTLATSPGSPGSGTEPRRKHPAIAITSQPLALTLIPPQTTLRKRRPNPKTW